MLPWGGFSQWTKWSPSLRGTFLSFLWEWLTPWWNKTSEGDLQACMRVLWGQLVTFVFTNSYLAGEMLWLVHQDPTFLFINPYIVVMEWVVEVGTSLGSDSKALARWCNRSGVKVAIGSMSLHFMVVFMGLPWLVFAPCGKSLAFILDLVFPGLCMMSGFLVVRFLQKVELVVCDPLV